MRREFRERQNRIKQSSNTAIFVTGGVLVLAIATFIVTFIAYSNKLEDDLYSYDSEYLAQYTNTLNVNLDEDTESASSSIGKTVEEAENVIKMETYNTNQTLTTNTIKNETTKTNTTTQTEKKKTNTKEKDPTFQTPVEGEILKEYAKDSLLYSETLKEWTTHLGVDIKAERATVVKAAANGTVKYIKNDPRYGLTIIIEHSNGFETRYANLLTTEFVSEGEEVKAGQTIGTVGDSAICEIVDESHLHFEILKNSENVNPALYIKF